MKKLLMMLVLFAGLALMAQNVPLVLTSPNGGEQWQAGSVYDITWEQTNLAGAVSLHLISPLSSQPPLAIAMNIPVQAQLFHWQIPASILPGDFYKVMISMASNPSNSFSDISDAPFTILGGDPPPPPVQITVQNPNGGEIWPLGSTQTINWTSQGLEGDVVITLVQANGVADYQIAAQVPIMPGNFTWTVPDDIMPGNGYRVHVMWLSDLTVYFGDVSDLPFSIVGNDPPPPQNLQLISPNGAEQWETGTTRPIHWVCSSTAAMPVTLKLYNGLNTNTPPILIAQNLPPFPGFFHWQIPATLAPSEQYYMQVSSLSPDGTIQMDLSDGPFSILNGTPPPPPQMLQIISPNGGETWVAGTMHPITWVQGFNAILPVTLTLHDGMDPAVAPIPIAINIPSFPSLFHWMIPSGLPLSNQYLVRISTPMADGTLVEDWSDSSFSIVNGNPPPPQTLRVISPNGGEHWMAGTMHPIRWHAPQQQGPVEIALMRGDDPQPALVIAPGLPIPGMFRWHIPMNLEAASDYRIRIRSLNANLADLSDAPFTILAHQAPPPSNVTLTSPNGGELWQAGNSYTITWNAPDLNVPMQLWLLREGQRERYRHIISNSLPNTGSFAWTIPPGVPSGDNYKVMVRALQSPGQMDISDAVFSIETNPAKLKATTNKGSDAVTISLDSESGIQAQVQVYNIRGQKVRDLGTLALGSTKSVIWDTRDDRGQKTSPGLYLIRVKVDREYLSQRVLLTK